MSPKRVLICSSVVPFAFGGSELLVRELSRAIKSEGYEVDTISIPYFWDPPERIFESVEIWKKMRLDESVFGRIDLVIATKFPTYAVVHPRKVAWVFHQHRAAYELEGTIYDDFARYDKANEYRERIREIDHECLSECMEVFTLSKRVSERMKKYCGIEGEPLYHPPPYDGSYRKGRFTKNVLLVSRLEPLKRVDLAINAMKHVKTRGAILRIVGSGILDKPLRELVEISGLEGRVIFEGFVSEERLLELYANCGCVLYVPFDEDYGYAQIEAFKSGKPVVVTDDSGGVLEFVSEGESGRVVEARPEAVAEAIDEILSDKRKAKRMGENGCESVSGLSWRSVIEELVKPFM